MLKVLFDARPIRPPISGVARLILDLFSSLNKKVNLYAFAQANMGRNSELQNLKIFDNQVITDRNAFFENILMELKHPPLEIRNIKKNIDLVHETFYGCIPLKNVPKVSSIYDVIPLDFPHYFNFNNRFFSKKNFHRQVKESKVIFTISEYSKKRIMHYSKLDIEKKIKVIPCMPSQQIIINKQSYNKFTINNLDILVIGNIEPRKNHLTVAKAIKYLNQVSEEKYRLIVIGKKIFQGDEIIAELNEILGENLIYKGFVSESEKIKLLQSTYCSVVASEYEGFGIPVIEAGIIGSPCFIANNSSLSELIVNEKQSFETFDHLQLAENIRNHRELLLTNHEPASYYKYCSDAIYEGYIDGYHSIIEK